MAPTSHLEVDKNNNNYYYYFYYYYYYYYIGMGFKVMSNFIK